MVYDFYKSNKRILPWRATRDPYRILLSELMLQQTQVARVMEKYRLFLGKFPTIASVASAQPSAILSAWSGLGYNRRALALKKMAVIIVNQYNGKIPHEAELLKKLPSVGDATANAVCAFAFSKQVVFLETNIRAVFIHHFFRDWENVKDSQILPLVEKMLDTQNPREWYYALMDYGVSLKRLHRNPARRSAHYQKQSGFAGSNRQIRGAIIRLLIGRKSITESSLISQLSFPKTRIKEMLKTLTTEGFIEKNGTLISIIGK